MQRSRQVAPEAALRGVAEVVSAAAVEAALDADPAEDSGAWVQRRPGATV